MSVVFFGMSYKHMSVDENELLGNHLIAPRKVTELID